MKIIEVRKLKTNYQITFDDYSKIIVDEDTIVKYRLIPGLEIDDLSILTKATEMNKIYEKAVRYSLYGKSEMQMINYLKKQGLRNTYDLIMRLRKDKFIDDYKLIKNLMSKRYSKAKLALKLKSYEFPVEKIDEIINMYDDTTALKYEFSLGIKKYTKETDWNKRNQKIYRYLLSKGFTESQVMSIMNIH